MKKSQKLLAILLCGTFLLTALPLSLAATLTESEQPVMQAFSKTALGGGEISFSADDFLSQVNPKYTLSGIVIASLPEQGSGTLKFGARDLLTGEAITVEALDALKFVPNTNGVLSTHFTFLPVFNESTPLERVTVGLNLLGTENKAPVAENFELVTCKNVAVTGNFKATDPDSDPLTFKITGKPKRGQIEIMSDGSFKYTPFENKTGNDSVTFMATDSFGNNSNEAKITIKIEKAPSRVTYADMNDSPAHYASLKLAEKGIFIGEKMGDQYYFNPNTQMSRGEFLALMVTAMGVYDGKQVDRTGFADDSVIPSWVKPYASAALKTGMISGITTADGRKALYAENPLSRAEAAVMVNNACQIANVGVVSVFADATDVPSWASQAVTNLDAADVLSTYADGTMRLEETMTREQAAQLVYNAILFKEHKDGKGGLLSWAFN